MAIEVPETPILAEYIELVKDHEGRDSEGRGVLDRRLERAERLLQEREETLAKKFLDSAAQLRDFFADPTHVPDSKQFFDARDPLADKGHQPDVSSTEAVGALFEGSPGQLWPVLGETELSFYYLERELAVTHARGMRLRSDRLEKLRLDLLLANRDGTPIVAELKVAEPNKRVDKDPFFALVQALAAAAYLSPSAQLERLRAHDSSPPRLADRLGPLDVYIVVAREPVASDVWFELRDRADRLAAQTAPLVGDYIRAIAAVDLDWLDTPSKRRRPQPRFVKRFAHRS